MILLKDIIDEFMLEASDQDSWVHRCNRTLALKHAKRGLEELVYAAQPEIRLVQQELPDHKTLDWPVGAVDIIRMSIVDYDGYLTPIYVNNRNPIALEYVKDSSGNLILGTNGLPIKASVDPTPPTIDYDAWYYNYPFDYTYGKRYGLKGGEINGAGSYRYEAETGRFHFFQIASGTQILFEYISSPLIEKPEEELSVPEYIREPITAFIYHQLVQKRSSVPMNEKMRAEKDYYRSLKKAKKRILIKPEEIYQAFKKSRSRLSW